MTEVEETHGGPKRGKASAEDGSALALRALSASRKLFVLALVAAWLGMGGCFLLAYQRGGAYALTKLDQETLGVTAWRLMDRNGATIWTHLYFRPHGALYGYQSEEVDHWGLARGLLVIYGRNKEKRATLVRAETAGGLLRLHSEDGGLSIETLFSPTLARIFYRDGAEYRRLTLRLLAIEWLPSFALCMLLLAADSGKPRVRIWLRRAAIGGLAICAAWMGLGGILCKRRSQSAGATQHADLPF